MRGTSSALAALMMLAIVLVPAGSAGPDELPEYPHKYGWSAPDDQTGSLIVEVGFDYGADNACLIYFGAAGRSDNTGLHRIAMSDRGGWSAGSGGSTATHVAQAHVGPVDTRDITDDSDGRWASKSWRWGDHFFGNETWTFAAFGLEMWSYDDTVFKPFEFEVSCRDPFTVTGLAGSTSVIGFDAKTMEGAGASFSTLLGPEGAVNVQDGVGDTFDNEEVVLAIRGFSIVGASAGRATLEHPGGTTSQILSNAETDMDFRGPTGTYDLRVDRAGVAQADAFWGILGGLDTVDDLDEIVA